MSKSRKANLLGQSRVELEQLFTQRGEARFRGQQLFRSIHHRRLISFANMTDLPRPLREQLAHAFDLRRPRIDLAETSRDGTRKYRFVGLDDTSFFEAVYVPEVARGRQTNTLCVSSQTGCSLGCRFCFTASLRHHRNLTPAEIVGQVLAVQDDVSGYDPEQRVSNIVFMGMGEPLLNYQNVTSAIRILLDPQGADFSTRRITVSTAGVATRIPDLGRDLSTQLAISLNATTNEIRDQIMPINRTWPIEVLVDALRSYPLPKRRRFTIEYVLLAGLNDSDEDARRLPRLLRDIPVKINLLPLNPHPHTDLRPPGTSRISSFQRQLLSSGLNAIVRTTRGSDIQAACGQLGGP